MSDRLAELTLLYRDGVIDAPALAELQSLLRAEADARDLFAELLYHGRLIHRLHAAQRVQDSGVRIQPQSTPSTPTLRRSRSVWYYSGGAAALIALAAAAWFLFTSSPQPPIPNPSSATPSPVAMLSDFSADAVFAAPGSDSPSGGAPLAPGSNLPAGPIRLTAGQAQLMFASTAVVDLRGPCVFELADSNRGLLHEGDLGAYVPAPAQGFTIVLPHQTRIVDLGTAFNVHVDRDSASRVMVSQGRVQLVSPRFAAINLSAGQARAIDHTGMLRQPRAEAFGRWTAAMNDLQADPALVIFGDYTTAPADSPWAMDRFDARPTLAMDGAAGGYPVHLPQPMSAMTLAVWVKLQALDHSINGLLMSDTYSPAVQSVHWQILRDGRISLGIASDNNYVSPPLIDGSLFDQWHLLAATYDPAARMTTFYLDGAAIYVEPIQRPGRIVVGPAMIGRWNNPSDPRQLHGMVDDWFVLSRAMTAEQIKQLYEAGSTRGQYENEP